MIAQPGDKKRKNNNHICKKIIIFYINVEAKQLESDVMKRKRRLFITDYALTPYKRIESCGILCENDRIIAIGGVSGFSLDEPELEVYEIKNAYATPVFVDSHIHGARGFDASTPLENDATINDMSLCLAGRGVTSFVPTIVAAEPDVMIKNLADLAAIMATPCSGAEAVGFHIEGPFINPRRLGSQVYSCPIDLGFMREMLAAGNGLVKRMTFAPELPGALDLIEVLVTSGVNPSMGHSEADERETLKAIDAGARCCTHLFNAMASLKQREISLISVALTDNRVATELIIDGRHIHPRMIDLTCRCKPLDKVIAISNATMAAGQPNGKYHIGGTNIRVENGFSQTLDGVLAGTTTLLDTGWHSFMSYAGTSEMDAARTVTVNPARSLALFDRGELAPRMQADIAVFDRITNRPLMTICRGNLVFSEKNFKVKAAQESADNED